VCPMSLVEVATLNRTIGTVASMARRLVTDTQLIDRLSDLFRRVGYDGASLGAIAMATGLQKSSLYHRFPGGKQQMAAEASASVIDEFAASVLAPIGSDAPLEDRVAAIAANLDRFYDGGTRYCLVDMLSIGDPGSDAASNLAAAVAAWIAVFASLAREAGADDVTARARAEDAVATIEGALVVARVTGDRSAFRRAVDDLADRLLGRT
jgi:TetR/AcrR family transcriptional repressor of lmrAB and yxaGH operons